MLKICNAGTAEDCISCNNKCQECRHFAECDYPWISEIWKKNSKLLTPLIPGWVKPTFREGKIVSYTGKYDFCIFNAPKRKDTITIQDICISEEGRGQGIARKLLTELMNMYDRDIVAKCIKGSSADSFWSHLGVKIGEEPSKQSTLCIYQVDNPNKKQVKFSLWEGI